MMVVYALITILVGYAAFTVLYSVYMSIIHGGEDMQEGMMCNILLSLEGAGKKDNALARLGLYVGEETGKIPVKIGTCSKGIVIKPMSDLPSTPSPETSDNVLFSLADEVNKCWRRSRLATGVEFTCVHSLKFKLSDGNQAGKGASECGLTYALCNNELAKFKGWRENVAPGNTDGGCGVPCPGGENVEWLQIIQDSQIHSLRIYYDGKGKVKIEKQY